LAFTSALKLTRPASRQLSAQTLGGNVSLEDLGNIGELIGALAVVVSLIYLAVQIRQNTAHMRENSEYSKLLLQENFVSSEERFATALLTNDEMYRVWRIGSTTNEELHDEDREKFGLMIYAEMYRYHFLYRARTIEPMEYKRSLIQIDRFAAMPAVQRWWSRQREGFFFDPEFVELVDERIRKHRPTGPEPE